MQDSLLKSAEWNHPTFNALIPPTARKQDGQYALGRTGIKDRLLTRGTPTPADDIQLLKGQAYTSLSSASEGTSYVTCLAPDAEAWDKRRKSTIIHWIDALWAIPMPTSATAGTVFPLTTAITRSTNGNGVEGWKVRYTIVGGAPAEFAPTGSQTAEVVSGTDGRATVQLRQVAGQFDPGTTQVRVDVIRPRLFGEAELTVESGVTSVTWSAPALTIRAIGPKTAGMDEPFNYRVEVSNPGDQLTRGVILSTKNLSDDLTFVSSDPKPAQYGRDYQWQLGDIPPGSPPRIVNVQMKSRKRGNVELCFEVASQTDQLRTEACAQTEIAVPCIGLEIDGPEQAKVGDQIAYNLVLVNQCDEPLRNVRVDVQYDSGLRTESQGGSLRAEIGLLEFGQRREIPLYLDVVAPGTRCFNLQVTADGGHTARARRCVEATQGVAPQVGLSVEGRRAIEQGQQVLIRGTIVNNGNVPLTELTATVRSSSSLTPRNITDRYNYRFQQGELIVAIGRLDPGESAILEVLYEGEQQDGDAFSEFTITSLSGAAETQRYRLRVEPPGTIGDPNLPSGPPAGNTGEPTPGIPGDSGTGGFSQNQRADVRVTVRTLDPAIAVGGTGRIEFAVENVSQAVDQNVDISMLIPPGLALVDLQEAQGRLARLPTSNTNPNKIELQRLLNFRAGDRVTFTATVRGIEPGTYPLEIQATSDNSIGEVTGRDQIVVSQ